MFSRETTEENPTTETRRPAPEPMELLKHPDRFVRRHIGPGPEDIRQMLQPLGVASLDELVDAAVPANIRLRRPLRLPGGRSEFGILNEARSIAAKNQVFRSYIGLGYHDCITPPVIQRNILENPGWYTPYTPYQAEISQGRLEMLLNFQTLVCDLTGLEIANASLLDEATAAAEAMMMCHRLKHDEDRNVFFVSQNCHPQNVEVVRTRAKALGVEIVIGDHHSFAFDSKKVGALVQYPDTFGAIHDYEPFVKKAHAAGAIHLSKGVIERDIEKTIPDKNAKLVLYCGGGFRSALATDNLQKIGYTNVISLDGGWRAIEASGLPFEKG